MYISEEILSACDKDPITACLLDLVRDGITKAYPGGYDQWRRVALGILHGDDFNARVAHVETTAKVKDPAAYWEVVPGVRLTRYRGTNVTRLIAVRKGREGNADVVFEIRIDNEDRQARIERDGHLLFKIDTLGLCPRRLQTAAISVLRSYIRENRHCHHYAARARKRCAAEAAAHE